MEPIDRRMLLGAAGLAGVAAMSKLASAGPLMPPPGPVSPTGKTLSEVEPRLPVQSLPGSATALHVISEPGSYYLTGNIQGVAGKHGIEILTDNVTIDLSGFVLAGALGSGCGVLADSFSAIEVRNGVISLWSGDGLRLAGRACIAASLRVVGNDATGLWIGEGGLVDICVAESNQFFGIRAGQGCNVMNSVSRNTRAAGGFFLSNRGRIVGCVAEGNAFEGIRADFENLISSNVCSNNSGPNIAAGNASRCVENVCRGGPTGITASVNATIVANTCEAVGVGIEVGASCFVGRNTVVAADTPYVLPATASHGPIVNVSGVGDISSVAGANHPWANFIY